MQSKVQTQSPEFGTTKEDRVRKPAARQLKCPGRSLRTIEMVCWWEILRIDKAKHGGRNLKGHPKYPQSMCKISVTFSILIKCLKKATSE